MYKTKLSIKASLNQISGRVCFGEEHKAFFASHAFFHIRKIMNVIYLL